MLSCLVLSILIVCPGNERVLSLLVQSFADPDAVDRLRASQPRASLTSSILTSFNITHPTNNVHFGLFFSAPLVRRRDMTDLTNSGSLGYSASTDRLSPAPLHDSISNGSCPTNRSGIPGSSLVPMDMLSMLILYSCIASSIVLNIPRMNVIKAMTVLLEFGYKRQKFGNFK